MADDIKKLLEEHAEETKRHFDVVAERLDHKIDIIVEGFELHTQQLDRMEKGLEILEPMQHDLEAVRITLQAVNLIDLKEQVTDLQKRVA